MKPQENVRQAAVSGQFYPDDAATLEKKVNVFLSRARSKANEKVCGLIVPHAGYDYSGRVAAEAYRTVRGRKFDAVIIVAFLHRVSLPGVWVDTVDAYELPGGLVPVDQELAREIQKIHPLLQETYHGPLDEHSLEVQIPFLQAVIPGLKIVPVYFGSQDVSNIKILTKALKQIVKDRNLLIVATSDLSHFHPYDTAVRKDRRLIELVEAGDFDALCEASLNEEAEACGIGPILTMRQLAKEAGWSRPILLRYENSGDVTGDHRSVVGYAAFAFEKKASLGTGEKKDILDYVRGILKNALEGQGPVPVLRLEHPVLEEKRGIFVTLKKEKKLRGCIGQIWAQQPLRENLREMALAAAFEDPRFPPVGFEELDQIEIHISILTPPSPIQSFRDIRLGTDGIIVSCGGRKGVYLPEVATETGWNQETFFRSCALEKAGLREPELKKAVLEVFQTEGFGDEEF